MKKQKKNTKHPSIAFPKLIRGTLIRRYKRFLADVALEDGRIVTAHCPNTGSMKGCSQAGRPVYLSESDNPRRKLSYTWELIEMPSSLVGVNTGIPNRLVYNALSAGIVPELSGYERVRKEVSVGNGSRIDIVMEDRLANRCFVEIKNCTLVEDGVAQFPDAVTGRGLRHLLELSRLVSEGHRCAMFYLIQRTDAASFAPAAAIDPEYSRGLAAAEASGVKIIAYDVRIDLDGVALNRKLPVRLPGN
ncbi:MAG: DNA/RNA nuclease SfsA [Desulfobacterales bacterium]|nr:DNA/RNA nuclease SfsA [Desulfobacterales bacterium]